MTKEAGTSLDEKVREQEIQIDRISTTLEVLLERREKEKADFCRTISADIKKKCVSFSGKDDNRAAEFYCTNLSDFN
ncbi:hypothetical protein DSCW_53220 [Desulfosarcina widdelii]|uniref:Uncharacterized protein n=1 Tax=Desulfosarcina widdelii TaxID=947919 RepID=A0A5K7ZAZ2_9BACT|nr:hypothetical protein [Desulfosarcina widdelii]BBO77905.1 hypothetical protein DSCW_53220 [Desulfosarcina widdelii]